MTYILVTGGLGFIGSHTVLELLDKQYKIIIIDNLSNSSKDVLKVFKNILFFQIDVRSRLQLENLFVKYRISAVIHFAALKAVSESITNPLQYYDNNICGNQKNSLSFFVLVSKRLESFRFNHESIGNNAEI
jgi:UDP-glucose 4-epimerase